MSPPGTSPPEVAETADHAANHAMRWWILAVLGVAQLMVILDNTVVNIALPTAQHALGFSNADRQWVVTAYALAFGSLLLLGGRIGDLFGRKRTLIIGLAGFAGASAIGGASVNFPMLVTARTVQGAFGALLAPSVLALLTTTFTDFRERGKAFAIYGGIAEAGGALGLLLGGILTSYASWRWTLYINLVFAAVATVGAVLWLKNDRAADRDPLDIPGLLLVTGGLFCLVYGFSHAETTAWSNPFTIGFLVVGVILLASFAVLETRARYPLLPPRIIQNRTRGGSILAMLFASMGLFGVFLFLTYYLQEILRFSPVKTGFAFLHDRRARGDGAGVQPGAAAPIGSEGDSADRVSHERRGVVPPASRRAPQLVREPRAALPSAARPGVRPESGPLVQHRHPGTQARRCRGGVGHPQHLPAGRRLHRHGPAQHARRRHRYRVPGGPGGIAGEPAGGSAAQLHHLVRVLRAGLRRGRGSRGAGAPQGQHADPVGTAPGRHPRGTGTDGRLNVCA